MDKIHLRIGSSVNNDMVIDSEGVDGNHLELFCDLEGNVFITDLNTKNGTYINGEELNGYALLKQGDKVILGHHYVFRWESFVRNDTSKTDPKSESDPSNDTSLHSEMNPSGRQNSVQLGVANIELIIIYAAIVIVLILMYILF